MLFELDGVELVAGDGAPAGPGRFEASSRSVRLPDSHDQSQRYSQVSWSDDQGNHARLAYPAIIMHSISTDPTNYPRPCIYCQVALRTGLLCSDAPACRSKKTGVSQ